VILFSKTSALDKRQPTCSSDFPLILRFGEPPYGQSVSSHQRNSSSRNWGAAQNASLGVHFRIIQLTGLCRTRGLFRDRITTKPRTELLWRRTNGCYRRKRCSVDLNRICWSQAYHFWCSDYIKPLSLAWWHLHDEYRSNGCNSRSASSI
jgi:hypothetical protein